MLEILNRQAEKNSINKIIDDVLTEVFGKKATLYIYKYLEDTYELYTKSVQQQTGLVF